MAQRKTRWSSSKDWNKFARYKAVLDPADTLFAANYLLGYFRSAADVPHLMRLQKEEDLKEKGLWDSDYKTPFKSEAEITGSDFGINVYACGAVVDGRKVRPDHELLQDLTTTHIPYGGYGCYEFVVTLADDHQSARLVEGLPPHSEFVLGFIRFDAGALQCKPLQEYLGQTKITGDFANAHIIQGKGIVPTQNFGSLLRGGKLISLIAISNELRDFWNQHHKRNAVVFYTQSLYGSSKSSSQYDQLDRYMQYIGDSVGTTALRMKNPHRIDLIDWIDGKGVPKSDLTFGGSYKADRSSEELKKYVRHCLWSHQKDKNIKELLDQFDLEMEKWKSSKAESKRTYVSIYGMPEWDENLVSPDYQVNPEFSLESIFAYWKKKVFKEKAWGMRKTLKNDSFPIQLKYELLNEQLKMKDFNQVR